MFFCKIRRKTKGKMSFQSAIVAREQLPRSCFIGVARRPFSPSSCMYDAQLLPRMRHKQVLHALMFRPRPNLAKPATVIIFSSSSATAKHPIIGKIGHRLCTSAQFLAALASPYPRASPELTHASLLR